MPNCSGITLSFSSVGNRTLPKLHRQVVKRCRSYSAAPGRLSISCANAHFDGPVMVVSHTMTIATIVCAALGLDLGNIHHLKIDLASRSTIVFSQFGMFSLWRLALLNDRQHLDAGLR